ncbi:hypothetical protein MSPP1_002373 [Malassezia sp. CBS 17886]|nr:hypothetical protein MSPP1_002373 [Malassezia sp. CBS 17886]
MDSEALDTQCMHSSMLRAVSGHEKKRRRRTRPHEADILMAAYVQNAFPNERTRARLGATVGMAPRAVSIWFQNRRQAEKKRSMRFGGSGMCVTAHAPTRVPLRASVGPRDLGEALGPQKTQEGHGVIADAADDPVSIWKRMESSSALGNSSDIDDTEPLHGSGDDDEEEMTLRRLAQRRLERARERKRAHSAGCAASSADAREAIQERVQRMRAPLALGLKRQPSLSLERAAGREHVPSAAERAAAAKPAAGKLRRVESAPSRAPLGAFSRAPAGAPSGASSGATAGGPSGASSGATAGGPSGVSSRAPAAVSSRAPTRPARPPLQPLPVQTAGAVPTGGALKRRAAPRAHAPPNTQPMRMRRVVSAPGPRAATYWCPASTETRPRESSARSAPHGGTPPRKEEMFDDSGYFDEENEGATPEKDLSSPESGFMGKCRLDRAHGSDCAYPGAAAHSSLSENDRCAVELLLGLADRKAAA